MYLGSLLLFAASSDTLDRLCYLSLGKGHGINLALFINLNIQPFRKGIYYTGSYTVKTAGNLITGSSELSSCMKDGENNFQGGLSRLFLYIYRNSSSIIPYGNGIILMNSYGNGITKSGQSLVYGVIHDFINQMMQTANGGTSDIHSRSFSNRFQSLQNLNLICTVFLRTMKKFCFISSKFFHLYRHSSSSLLTLHLSIFHIKHMVYGESMLYQFFQSCTCNQAL